MPFLPLPSCLSLFLLLLFPPHLSPFVHPSSSPLFLYAPPVRTDAHFSLSLFLSSPLCQNKKGTPQRDKLYGAARAESTNSVTRVSVTSLYFFFLLIFVFLFPIVGTVGFLLMLWDDHTLCYGGGGGGGSGTVKKKAVLVPYSYLIHIHSLGRSGKDGAGVCLSCIV